MFNNSRNKRSINTNNSALDSKYINTLTLIETNL